MNYIIKNEDGATSVLVLLMMIVLVALGSFAIVSASSSIKLSNTSISWNTTYYNLDAQGEEYLSKLDNILYQAEQSSVAYILGEGFNELTHSDLDIKLQTSTREIMENEPDKEKAIREAFNIVYFEYIDMLNKEFINLYPNNIESKIEEDGIIKHITHSISFVDDTNPDYSLEITLDINKLDYNIFFEDNVLYIERNLFKRYSIDEWKQKQTLPIVEDEGIELWDGVLPNK